MEKSVRIFELNEFNYPKFRTKIVILYLHAFTTGQNAQFITPQAAESSLDEMMRHGFGAMAFAGDRLAGVSVAFPLAHDTDFPRAQCPQIVAEKTVYISEVMTHADFRGMGIASQMIENVLKTAAHDGFSSAVIRVWNENKPALSLYQKLGFEEIAAISQTKLRAENETFEMRKIYLGKPLN